MPKISAFHGIVIRMHWNERDHPIAHFHAECDGHSASVAIDGAVLAGNLPPRAISLVSRWARLHRDELLTNWTRARRHEPIAPIDPLP
jgi:hypothetical protein